MAIHKGRLGAIKKNSVAVAQIKDWKIDTSIDIKDATCLGDTAKVKFPDLFDFKGSFTLIWDPENTEHAALFTALKAGDTLDDIEFFVDATHKYSGDVIISTMGINAPVGDFITNAVGFEGSDVLDYV